jgi:site-specific DNA-methyltransferase (adenine-specific)
MERREDVPCHGDSGGASRFFYTAKAATDERVRVNGVAHPTVKPLSLMRWLVRLVTPPGGTVLEPFAGSGTTVEACILEGFRCIAIEREADYLPLIVQRINRRRDPVAAVRGSGEDGGLFDLLGEEGTA